MMWKEIHQFLEVSHLAFVQYFPYNGWFRTCALWHQSFRNIGKNLKYNCIKLEGPSKRNVVASFSVEHANHPVANNHIHFCCLLQSLAISVGT